MNILVTGGLGFVGINLVRVLAEAPGCRVIATDVRPWTETHRVFLGSVADRVRPVQLDVRDRRIFRDLVESERISHIVHAAAITPSYEQEHDRATFIVDVNLLGAVNALAVGYDAPSVEQVLLCSSSGVYGAPTKGENRLQDESGPLDLDNLYAVTKISAEGIAQRFAQLGSTRMASIRIGSVYGALEAASDSRQQISQVQRLANALRQGRSLRLAGPHIRRDWVYARDVGLGVLALLLAPAWHYPVYNLGSGQAISFENVVAPFVQRGLVAEWVDDPQSADIAMTSVGERAALDLSRLSADTGFSPRFTFAAGLDDYLGPRG